MKDVKNGFFSNSIFETDPSLFNAIEGELSNKEMKLN